LGSMNAKLLEKIEELHLYILQQNNKSSEDRNEISLLKKQLADQEMKWKEQQKQIDDLKKEWRRPAKKKTGY
jgi:hypothetical protein